MPPEGYEQRKAEKLIKEIAEFYRNHIQKKKVHTFKSCEITQFDFSDN